MVTRSGELPWRHGRLCHRAAAVLGCYVIALCFEEEEPPQAVTGVGHCLGDCFSCHSFLESLPRARLAAATTHADPTRVGFDKVEAFLDAPEVCDVQKFFPLSIDREVWSLAGLPGGAGRLRFQGALSQVRAVTQSCATIQELSVSAFAEAARLSPAASAPSSANEAARGVAVRLTNHWHHAVGSSPGHGTPGATDRVSFADGGNESGKLVEAYKGRVERALLRARADGVTSVGESLIDLPFHGAASRTLVELAMELAKYARLLIEHARTLWGVRDLMFELRNIYPRLEQQMPNLVVHSDVYGRHWDVLERLLHELATGSSDNEGVIVAGQEAPLRMAEMGVACGPIGIHLLPRFPSLRYVGADPKIKRSVWAAYRPYAGRARLFANTSDELHRMLPSTEIFDLVFVDGPHTYRNVRNDLELWVPRVRRGGLIVGHDFTCAHPPLLWAVNEYRIAKGAEGINLAMDGVWWWRVE